MSNKLYINLLPKDIRKKRKAERGLLFLIAIIAFFIGALITISILFGANVRREEAKLAELKEQTKKVEEQIIKFKVFKDRKEEIAQHREVITKAIDKQLFWHRFLNELSMVIPNNVSIDDLQLKDEGIDISGKAFNHQGVAEFLVRMSDLDELKDVWITGSKDSELEQIQILGSSSDSSTETDVTIKGVEFNLTAKLKNPGPGLAATEGAVPEAKKSEEKKDK